MPRGGFNERLQVQGVGFRAYDFGRVDFSSSKQDISFCNHVYVLFRLFWPKKKFQRDLTRATPNVACILDASLQGLGVLKGNYVWTAVATPAQQPARKNGSPLPPAEGAVKQCIDLYTAARTGTELVHEIASACICARRTS